MRTPHHSSQSNLTCTRARDKKKKKKKKRVVVEETVNFFHLSASFLSLPLVFQRMKYDILCCCFVYFCLFVYKHFFLPLAVCSQPPPLFFFLLFEHCDWLKSRRRLGRMGLIIVYAVFLAVVLNFMAKSTDSPSLING